MPTGTGARRDWSYAKSLVQRPVIIFNPAGADKDDCKFPPTDRPISTGPKLFPGGRSYC